VVNQITVSIYIQRAAGGEAAAEDALDDRAQAIVLALHATGSFLAEQSDAGGSGASESDHRRNDVSSRALAIYRARRRIAIVHIAAHNFVATVAPDNPGAVLEIGSRNVNGSVRDLFSSSSLYHGIDIAAGPGVDEVADCADYVPDVLFDTCVSTEVLEHMQDPSELTSLRLALPALGWHAHPDRSGAESTAT
jgi:hypothetical protein